MDNIEKCVYIIIEKYVFQLQHRLYKAEKKHNLNYVFTLKKICTKSWSILVFCRFIYYKLNFLKFNLKKKMNFLLPEHYLTILLLEPEWEARFEKHSFGYRPGLTTYNAISVICKNLKQNNYYIFQFEFYLENKIQNNLIISTKINNYFSDFIVEFLTIKFNNQNLIQINLTKKNINIFFKINCVNKNLVKVFYLDNFSSVLLDKLVFKQTDLNNLKNIYSIKDLCNNKKIKNGSNLKINNYPFYSIHYKKLFYNKNAIKIPKFLLNSVICSCVESFYNSIFFRKKNRIIKKLTNLLSNQKIKQNLNINYNFFVQKNILITNNYLDIYYLTQTKTFLNLKQCYYLFNLVKTEFIKYFYKYQNYDLAEKKLTNLDKFFGLIEQKLIFKNFFNYWFEHLENYIVLKPNYNSNKEILKEFLNFAQKKEFLLISFKSKTPFSLKMFDTNKSYNKIILHQYHFLNCTKLSLNNNFFFEVNLQDYFFTNFSIFLSPFFTTKFKRNLLHVLLTKKNVNNTKKLFKKQKKTENQVFVFDFKNNICSTLAYFMNQKTYFLQFSQKYHGKISSKKFLTLTIHSFYLIHLRLNRLCGFFINILLHGIESDFNNWINLKKIKNICFVRYGNRILLMAPYLKNLKIVEKFFKNWCFSKNIKLKLINKTFSYSLNNDKNAFIKKEKFMLFSVKEIMNQSKKFKMRKILVHIPTNYYKEIVSKNKDFFTINLLIKTEFSVNTKNCLFLKSNSLFFVNYFLINYFIYLNSFSFLYLNLINTKINNYKNKLKIVNKNFLYMGYLSPMFFFKTVPMITFFKKKIFEKKFLNSQMKRGLNFLGFYIYQSQFSIKKPIINSANFCFNIYIVPSKLALKYHLTLLKKIIKRNLTKPQQILIQKLSSFIRIWYKYYNIVSNKKIHAYCDFLLFKMLWKWACKRHSKKSKKWIKSKYFHCLNGKNWVFGVYRKSINEFYCLPNHTDVKLTKYNMFENYFSIFNFELIFWTD